MKLMAMVVIIKRIVLIIMIKYNGRTCACRPF